MARVINISYHKRAWGPPENLRRSVGQACDAQCDISTGTIIWRKSVRLTLPRIAWLMREWP